MAMPYAIDHTVDMYAMKQEPTADVERCAA